MARKWNLWGYIDARDGAQAVRLALEHQATGSMTASPASYAACSRADSAAPGT